MAKGFWCGVNTFRQIPDIWLVVEVCKGDFDCYPHYDDDGPEEEAAEKIYGGTLAAICGSEEDARSVARYLSN
jgi:hypothetical protein